MAASVSTENTYFLKSLKQLLSMAHKDASWRHTSSLQQPQDSPAPGVCRMSGLRRRPPGEDTTTRCQQTSSKFCSGARLDVQKARDLEDAASPPQRCPPSMGSDPHWDIGHCRWKTERDVCFLMPRADTCVLGFGSRKKFVPPTWLGCCLSLDDIDMILFWPKFPLLKSYS